MKKCIFLLSVAGILFSCQREDAPASFTDETTISVIAPEQTETNTSSELALVALTGQTHISVEEAQQTALFTATQMREMEGIATKFELQIASIDIVKDGTRKPYVATKSGIPERGDVYIINFANGQGYVVTSADRRVPGVFAYNSYGEFG